jgi:hypothetical protein
VQAIANYAVVLDVVELELEVVELLEVDEVVVLVVVVVGYAAQFNLYSSGQSPL